MYSAVIVVYTPPHLLSCLLILPPHLHSILCSLSPLYHALVFAVLCQSIMRYSEVQIISLPVVLSDPVSFCLFFLVLSVWRSCFCNPSFFYTPASLGLWSALCLGFSLPVCQSLHSNPSRFSSARARRFLWFSAAAFYCLLAAALPRWLGWSRSDLRAVQVDYLLAVYAIRLIVWDWAFFCFHCFNKFCVIHLLLDPGLVSDKW